MSFNPLQYLEPYAMEAREWAAGMHTDGMAMCHRIIAHLQGIEAAVRESEWGEAPERIDRVYADVEVVDDVVARVPMGTMWMLDTWNAIMLAGTAILILRANGSFRGGSTIGTSGMGTAGSVLSRNTIFMPGDTITISTSGLTAGETMQVYLQFHAVPIRAVRRAVAAGRKDPVATNVINANANAEDNIARESQPGVTMVPHPASGGDRPMHGAAGKALVLGLRR